jgi:ribosomal protein S18 acetylase RimI-like enzyme
MPERSSIEAAQFPRDLEIVRTLFREYATSLGFDLCFQGFDDELATLPGKYAVPTGGLFLARRLDAAAGCVAFRPLKDGDCEMKRLYVRPAARGEKLGRRLAAHVCEAARAAGYRRICLDTIDSMREAITLYESLGFHEIAPYVFNPIAGAKYFAREL